MEECDRGLRFDKGRWDLDLVHGRLLGDSKTFAGRRGAIMPHPFICNGSSGGFPSQGSQPLDVWSHVSGFVPNCISTHITWSHWRPLSMLLQQPTACSTSCLPAELLYFLRLNWSATLGRSFLNPFKFWGVLPFTTQYYLWFSNRTTPSLGCKFPKDRR